VVLIRLMPGSKKNSHQRHTKERSKLRPGQPTKCCKLDNRIESRLCRYIREGLAYEVCTALAGISKQTFYSWKNCGESEPDSRYGQFARAVEKANAEAIRTLHTEVKRSDPKFILERRFSNYYPSPKIRSEVTGTDGGPIQTEAKGNHKIVISCTKPTPQFEFPIIDWKDWDKWEASEAKKDFDRWVAEMDKSISNRDGNGQRPCPDMFPSAVTQTWIACVDAFSSTVMDKTEPGRKLIRARCEKDIKDLFNRYRDKCPSMRKPTSDDTRDYRYRLSISRRDWVKLATELASEVDYSNFKNAIHKRSDQDNKSHPYLHIWPIMHALQVDEGSGPSRGESR
jgi:hypothetical protein